MHRPRILLTNDDGIDSPYLKVLARALRESLGAEVLAIAPERQRSAMSHTITLHKPLRVEEREPGFYAVSGTPVDCVYVGVLKLSEGKPDLVISGPNDGFNLGTDVFYSGTVGAAIEGGLRGLPSLAVSVDREGADSLTQACSLVCSLAERMLADPLPPGTVLNLNVPKDASTEVRWTHLGKRFYEDDVHERTDPRGRTYVWIGGGTAGAAEIAGSDCHVVINQGVASVTPLHLDLTLHQVLKTRPAWRLEGFELE